MEQRQRHVRPSLTATLVAAGTVGLGVAWLAASRGQGWFGRFLASRLTVLAGCIGLASLLAIWMLARALWTLGRTERKARRFGSQDGTAAVEFALVFPVALTIVLIMIQSMLLVSGNLAVSAAAYAATRAAVAWIPEKLVNEPRNQMLADETSIKRKHVWDAAVFAVMPACPGKRIAGVNDGASPGLVDGMAAFFQRAGKPVPNWVSNVLAAKYGYASNEEMTQVEIRPPADGSGTYGVHEDIAVRVSHRLYLSVPYVNRIFGEALGGGGGYATATSAAFALPNEGVEDDIDAEEFPRVMTP